ncbi:RAD26 (YJR035W) [Zygosaccharomyces parabailii]|uniref:DNA helicase n=1 Tax=Zygosaccharomyces bailii (strain CLIB 213 / ATCC 58445 / CBS 680 / BCRC 21525 / NBRC 1098 / NCYC 1416 / NRRL Y-2227) TaxID=1333698 RepID=A0A8J2T7B1_ZYGB2|nr:RAD26 (YJR035W) [Zygosaccharomyces parabailii]CDF90213.1 ZYBA0S06-03334g1_1 [Zygosaccharomyces bailii CLIB 213]
MDSNEGQLHDLGVDVLSQSTLENKIQSDASILISQQLLDQENSRLERARNALEKCNHKIGLLSRKCGKTSRISVKQRLREQIDQLKNKELPPILSDISDIEKRIKDLKTPNSSTGSEISFPGQGKKSGESDRDFLVRTGQLTAFGTKRGFEIASESDQESSNETQGETDAVDQSPKSDTEYKEESIVYSSEDESDVILKPSAVKDDGDEYYYQKRLRQWSKNRAEDRKSDSNPDWPEWWKKHPDFPDAKLDDQFKIPGEIYSLLFDYQRTCVQWLYELYQQKCGGIIGDEMGLGKTIQIIAFLAALHHSNLLNGPTIVVCPATVMKQWCNEFHHWWPPFRTVILHSIGAGMSGKKKMSEAELEEVIMSSEPSQFSYEDFQNSDKTKSHIESNNLLQSLIDKVVTKGHIIITTYVGLRVHADMLLKVNWAYAILDEGHKIRNPDSDISLTCKALKTPNRIILSGTPIQNNLTELWSLFDFIFPGKLGTLPIFQQQFVQPINMGGYANASNIQVQTGYKCAVALRDLISPYLLRRVKADVAKDLPEKKEMVLFCKLTQIQRRKYLEFLHSRELDEIKGGKRKVLFGIDILRKICNHPDLLERNERRNETSYGDPKRSGKMQVVKQLLLLWKKEGHKALLFTQSRQMLDILEEFIAFKDEELSALKFLRMDGTTSISVRQSLVDEFNKGNYDVFLLTTRVGGLGVNLTGANRIIIFDPDWNPSTDMQARERAWRIGQTREVSIYRLMVTGSIEEKIYHRQIFKQFLTNKILSDPKQKRFFKMNELQDLFTLGGENGHATEELESEVQKRTEGLKSSKTEESDDFEEVISLNGVSKLESFYTGKEPQSKFKKEDDRLIEGLLGESGLASAASHDSMIESHSKGSSDIISREASKLAEAAVKALRKSRRERKKFDIETPTWTGRFGQAGKIGKKSSATNRRSIGSSAILENIRKSQKQAEIMPTQESTAEEVNESQGALQQIEHFLLQKPGFFASSNEIVNSINVNLSTKEDIIKIRALLKSIATFNKRRKGWILNQEFTNDD